MKYRTGFVSNSSTSSFLAVGFETGKEGLELAKALGIATDEKLHALRLKFRKEITASFKKNNKGSIPSDTYVEESVQDHLSDHFDDDLYDSDHLEMLDEGPRIVGKRWLVSEYDLKKITQEEILSAFKEAKKFREILGEPDAVISLYTGTVSC